MACVDHRSIVACARVKSRERSVRWNLGCIESSNAKPHGGLTEAAADEPSRCTKNENTTAWHEAQKACLYNRPKHIPSEPHAACRDYRTCMIRNITSLEHGREQSIHRGVGMTDERNRPTTSDTPQQRKREERRCHYRVKYSLCLARHLAHSPSKHDAEKAHALPAFLRVTAGIFVPLSAAALSEAASSPAWYHGIYPRGSSFLDGHATPGWKGLACRLFW